jgi:hypothetical protein
MAKPPMVCARCGNQYHVQQDSIQCECGQMLYRVTLTPNGPQGPPEMPEKVREQMVKAWEWQQGDSHRKQVQDGFAQEMRDWALQNGVRPLDPEQVRRDARAAFGREAEDATREDFYASWSAYDAALEAMPPRQQQLQRRAEVLELERMLAL